MKKDIAENLYKRIKETSNDLPKSGSGEYRGYLKVEVGNSLKEILDFISNEEIKFEYLDKGKIKQEINLLFSILPSNSSGKLSGYLNVEAGKGIKTFLDNVTNKEIIPSISPEKKKNIDSIARSALLSNSLFSSNSPKRKISECCHSITQSSYNKISLNNISDVNLQNLEGITLLTRAVQEKNKELADHLISQCKADVDARNANFMTPLHYAIASNNVDMVKFLLEKGADPQAYAPEPEKINTPLACAFEQGNEDIIKILLERIKENVNDEDIGSLSDLAEQFNKLNLLEKVGIVENKIRKDNVY